MNNFVDFKINGEQFRSEFNQLHRSNQEAVKILKKDLRQLNTFEPNPKSFGFTEWTSEIDLACDEFYPNFQPQDQVEFAFALNEENFRTFIAHIIPQIQKYCEENRINRGSL